MSAPAEARALSDAVMRARSIVRTGVVVEANFQTALYVVDFGGGVRSPPIPASAARMGAVRVWAPPQIGEQVLVFSEDGLLAHAVIGASLAHDGAPEAGEDGKTTIIEFSGITIRVAPESGYVFIKAPSVVVDGDMLVSGDLKIMGDTLVDNNLNIVGKTTLTDLDVSGETQLKDTTINDIPQSGR